MVYRAFSKTPSNHKNKFFDSVRSVYLCGETLGSRERHERAFPLMHDTKDNGGTFNEMTSKDTSTTAGKPSTNVSIYNQALGPCFFFLFFCRYHNFVPYMPNTVDC